MSNLSGINDGVFKPLYSHSSYKQIIGLGQKKALSVLATGVLDSQKAHLIAAIRQKLTNTSLIITYSELKAKEICHDLEFFLKGTKILFYPAKDIIFYSADVKSSDIIKQRFNVLNALLAEENVIIVLSVESLFDRLTPKDVFEEFIIELDEAMEYPLSVLAEKLTFMGYERTSLVEGPGQFAVRGGIIDLYTTIYESAVRIEYFGDEIDSIRMLDLRSQRSVDNLSSVKIFPMRELVYGESELSLAIKLLEKEFEKTFASFEKKGLFEESARLKSDILESVQRLKTEKNVSAIERFVQYFYDESATLLDYLPKDAHIYFDEPSRVRQRAENAYEEFNDSVKNRIMKGYLLPSQMNMVFSYTDILSNAEPYLKILFASITTYLKDFNPSETVHFDVKGTGVFKNRIDLLSEDIESLSARGFKIAILTGTKSKGERLFTELSAQDIVSKLVSDIFSEDLPAKIPVIAPGSIHRGFIYEDMKFALISDKELFGEEKKKRRFRKYKKGARIESFTDLHIGDYVVHDNHGVGIYKGIENITADNIKRDYLKLAYADGGHLYVPTNQMDMVTKYIAGDSAKPKISKLGGADWSKAKARAKGAVEILAEDLIKLYAARQAAKGHAFSKDTPWQKDFEEQFPYEETEDQLIAIEEVKKDMESPRVMDRLICGDVGYGKTEVAIRAAFKAVQEGKQVAYLVPTTILAQQHYNNFVYRMKDFPINVEMMSRFRAPKQLKETVQNIESGKADIVIGTHRILSKDIKFKDLGLIIVDEEQRFGVAHKEKLKQLKENVDVLTLTATPIPRTLHMSLTGIRDMSVLDEPPQERQPVQTYVMEYNPEFVKDAINRELARGGQVYYLYNRVRTISDMAFRIQNLVPEANVHYAHGQMGESELENIMLDFIEGEINVLVCTTIIETGLDISNVNTMIIHDADNMGLSQLYQLRGRVGRSNRLAYCYLLYKKDKVLQEVAEKRLQTIREFTEFGSGFKIAMRDLEIRGAGNLLGAQQHGHIDTVGYDMYCKLLEAAVKNLQGEEVPESFETGIDINISAYIPSRYIEIEEQKLEVYKKISLIANKQDYYDVQEEIEDRYGNLPTTVQHLLNISLLKSTANKLGIISIVQKGGNIVITFKNDANVVWEKITNLIKENKNKILFTVAPNPYITYKLNGEIKGKALISLNEMLETLFSD